MTDPPNQTSLIDLEKRVARIEEWIDFWETIETGWTQRANPTPDSVVVPMSRAEANLHYEIADYLEKKCRKKEWAATVRQMANTLVQTGGDNYANGFKHGYAQAAKNSDISADVREYIRAMANNEQIGGGVVTKAKELHARLQRREISENKSIGGPRVPDMSGYSEQPGSVSAQAPTGCIPHAPAEPNEQPVDHSDILCLMQDTFVAAYKQVYFKNPQGSHTVAIDAVFDAIRPFLRSSERESCSLPDEASTAMVIAGLQASLHFRDERDLDDVQPDSPGGIPAEMTRVVWRAMVEEYRKQQARKSSDE
jgi:hypothetical protein